MKKIFLYNKIVFQIILLFVVFVFGFVLFPQDSYAACSGIQSGIFRNYDYNTIFSEEWYESYMETNNETQPYIYLDVIFSEDCVGETVNVAVFGEMLGANNIVDGFDFWAFDIQNTQNTFVFSAGDESCILGCDYYFALDTGENTIYYDSSNSLVTKPHVSYNCYVFCSDEEWVYHGHANSTAFPQYQYGQFIASSDPSLLIPDDEQEGIGIPDDEQESEQSGILTSVSEQIENPLGNNGTLPDFIQALLAIVIKAGIPLVVLAFVYTGYLFVASHGNPDKLTVAKQALLGSCIGAVVLLGAWTIATILNNTITAIISMIHGTIV